jgi:hypothetical protein
MWIALLLIPALVVFSVHLLLLETCCRVATWRVRRHVRQALESGDEDSLRRAGSEVGDAVNDWPGYELWALGKAVEIVRLRLSSAA